MPFQYPSGYASPFNFGLDAGGVAPNKEVVINSAGDIPIVGSVPTFLADTTYIIGNAISDWPTQGVECQDTVAVFDPNMLGNKLTMSGTGTMLYGSGNVYLRGLTLDCPNGQFYDFNDPVGGVKLAILERNQNISCAKIGVFDNHFVTAIDFFKVDAAAQGLELKGVNKSVQSISRAAFVGTTATFVGIDQTTMVTGFLDYSRLTFVGTTPGSVAISGLPNSGNMAPGTVGSIIDFTVLGAITTLSGLSEDDTGYKFNNIPQVKDSTILGEGYITTSAATTVLNGTAVQVAGTFTDSSNSAQVNVATDGALTMLNRIPARVDVGALLEIDKPGGGTDTYEFKLQTDVGAGWVDLPESVVTKTFQGASTQTVVLGGVSIGVDTDMFRVVVIGVGTTSPITAVTGRVRVAKL